MLGIFAMLAGALSLLLALIVIIGGVGTKDNKWPFVGFATSVGVWAMAVGIFSMTTDEALATQMVYLFYIAALFIAYSLTLFCMTYGKKRLSLTRGGLLLLPVLAMSMLITPLNSMILEVSHASRSVELDSLTYGIYVVLFVAYSLAALWLSWHKAVQKKKVRQHRLLAIALTVSLAGGALFNLILPAFKVYGLVSLGPLFTFIMVLAVFYAIVRHGLFDIRFAVVRIATYTLSLSTLAVLYLVFALFVFDMAASQELPGGQQAINLVLVLGLAFLFQPIKDFFDKITNRLFYKDNYSIGDFIAKINRTLNSSSNLRILLERVSTIIADSLKADQVFAVVYLKEGQYLSAGTQNHKKVAAKEFEVFSELVSKKKDAITKAELEPSHPAYRMMTSHRVQLVMPLYKNNVAIGFLCLGDHKTFGYTVRDVKALLTVSDELAIAVQNALSIDEVRKLNDTLEQRIAEATKELRGSNAQLQRLDEAKDEFISMASHQLRTPLTSIKGYISMLIEGDVGKVSAEQKVLLEQVFMSSERMVRLISDFLNVSRLQTGKFVVERHAVDLALLVQRELDGLVTNAASRGVTLNYAMPKNIPSMELDENKIQQVVMNFVDNAIYYSKDDGKITVSLKKKQNCVEFTVKDNGIGVPLEEQEHLFGKFFRATNARKARPDGTGVGLFLAHKVIVAHGGSIIFASKPGKGSTFGFTLPIKN